MILAASGIILQEKKILLLQRSNYTENYPEFWGCPGGRAEIGETPEQNVIREVKEECNLDFTPTEIIKTGIWQDRKYYRFMGNWRVTPLSPDEKSIDNILAGIEKKGLSSLVKLIVYEPKELIDMFEGDVKLAEAYAQTRSKMIGYVAVYARQ